MTVAESGIPVDLTSLDANALVRYARVGRDAAFMELTRRFRPRLMHVLLRRFDGRTADAEDVAQETFVRVFQSLDRFNPRFQFSTWFYTIALRLAADHHRRNRRSFAPLPTDDDSLASRDRAVDVAVSTEEQVQTLWRQAQMHLNPNQYTALWLRFGEDLSLPEVASAMNMSQIRVRVMLHRARCRLLAVIPTEEGVHGNGISISNGRKGPS